MCTTVLSACDCLASAVTPASPSQARTVARWQLRLFWFSMISVVSEFKIWSRFFLFLWSFSFQTVLVHPPFENHTPDQVRTISRSVAAVLLCAAELVIFLLELLRRIWISSLSFALSFQSQVFLETNLSIQLHLNFITHLFLMVYHFPPRTREHFKTWRLFLSSNLKYYFCSRSCDLSHFIPEY